MKIPVRCRGIIRNLISSGKGGSKSYDYHYKDNSLSFAEQTEILKEKLKNKNRVLKGWPALNYSETENRSLITLLEKQMAAAAHKDTKSSGKEKKAINPVMFFNVDKNEYEDFLKKINYKKRYPAYYHFNFYEKTLEHFVAFKLLDLKKGDKFIDTAAEKSPHSREFSRLTGCSGYKQDIMFRPGIHGHKIGGSAAHIPVEDNFFQAALAACSIEHFEKDADIAFMKEMTRVLAKEGKILIIPLYLHKKPFCVTDPRFALPGGVEFDPGIDIHCVEEFQNRHGRFYSPETLYRRLIEPNMEQMNFTTYYIENFKEVHESVYCRFVLVGEKIV